MPIDGWIKIFQPTKTNQYNYANWWLKLLLLYWSFEILPVTLPRICHNFDASYISLSITMVDRWSLFIITLPGQSFHTNKRHSIQILPVNCHHQQYRRAIESIPYHVYERGLVLWKHWSKFDIHEDATIWTWSSHVLNVKVFGLSVWAQRFSLIDSGNTDEGIPRYRIQSNLY